MSQWYLSKNGKALGPLSSEKIISLIQEGDLNHLDLVYKAGDAEWQPLSQIEEFSTHLTRSEEPTVNEKAPLAEWVLLKKVKGEKGSEYKQLGPYSEEQVLDLVDEGVIKFTDFAWKKGLETWVRIAELEEFSQPLPSSPSIDLSLYEKTSPEIDVGTVTDANRTSMTEMVKIERFDHQKTQMMTSDAVENEEVTALEDLDADAVGTAPINTEEFATESNSDFDDNDSGDFNVDLWSLESPPEEKKTKKEEQPVAEVVEKKRPKPKKVEKEAKPKPKVPVQSTNETKKPLGPAVWQWGAAGVALVLSVIFVSLSLSSKQEEIIYEQPTDPKVLAQIAEQNRQDRIAQQRNRSVTPPPVDPRVVEREMRELKRKLEDAKVPQEVASNDDQKTLGRKRIPSKPVQKKKIRSKKASKAKVVKVKKVSPKKAKKIIAKKTKKKKRVPSRTARKASSLKRNSKLGTLASGSSKMKSFYKQRDRKALFYSSLRAEALAIEIQSQYKKIGKSRKKWSKFYKSWKKKAGRSLAKEIKNYPQRKEVYAYPKQLRDFKADFGQLYKFGESFDSKVRGARVPSGAPTGVASLFAKYKKQAISLGR